MFYSYFYKISFRILKNHRFYKKTGASWFYYHSHSCTTFNLCISSACLRPNLMPLRKNQESRLGSFLFIPSKLPFFIKYSNPLHFTLDLTFMEFTSFASYRRFNPGSFLHILFLLLAF